MTDDKQLSFRDPLLSLFFNLICHLQQANVSVRMAWISFGALPCREKKKLDSSRLDVVEIAHVPDTLPSLFPSWSD